MLVDWKWLEGSGVALGTPLPAKKPGRKSLHFNFNRQSCIT